MPQKRKKNDSGSDTSDSGPDDPQPASKSSKQEKAKSSKKGGGDDGDIASWNLEGKRFVKLREFRGKLMVDIREYYDTGGDLKPGRKGICLSMTQFRALTNLVPEIQEEIKKNS